MEQIHIQIFSNGSMCGKTVGTGVSGSAPFGFLDFVGRWASMFGIDVGSHILASEKV
jgi:hypothetical protein